MLIDFITPAEATASFKTFLVGGGIAVMVPDGDFVADAT
jgi:hypothetical protein